MKTLNVQTPEQSAFLKSWLGFRFQHRKQLLDHLARGLPISSFDHLCKEMDVPASLLAEVTRIAPRTLARRKKEGRLETDESERLYRLAALYDQAIRVLGSPDAAKVWFKSPKKALSGKSPLEYSEMELGAREVEELLGRLEHGVFG